MSVKLKCIECDTRHQLLDLEWLLASMSTAATVHSLANARCLQVGALEFIRHGMPNCARCAAAVESGRRVLYGEEKPTGGKACPA